MALNGVYSGAHGTISLAVEGSPEQQADFNAITTAYGEAILGPVGRVNDVELCVRTDLNTYYSIGARDPLQISAGNVYISGTIGRAYINGSLLFLLLGRGAKGNGVTTISPRFVLNLILQDPNHPEDSLKVNVFGVKLESWGMRVPQGDFILEKVSFKALTVGIIDSEDSNEINVAFPEQ